MYSAVRVHFGKTESSAGGVLREQPGKARARSAGDCQDKAKYYLVIKEVCSFIFCAYKDYEKQNPLNAVEDRELAQVAACSCCVFTH